VLKPPYPQVGNSAGGGVRITPASPAAAAAAAAGGAGGRGSRAGAGAGSGSDDDEAHETAAGDDTDAAAAFYNAQSALRAKRPGATPLRRTGGGSKSAF